LLALGRKVGVISHVPILVERIGAKVVVEKQGVGRSCVVILVGVLSLFKQTRDWSGKYEVIH
jgi:hypothetical protein